MKLEAQAPATYLLKRLSQVENDPVTEDLRHTLGYVLKKEREVKAKAHSASHQSKDYCWLVSLSVRLFRARNFSSGRVGQCPVERRQNPTRIRTYSV
jgi:hypothetical protein